MLSMLADGGTNGDASDPTAARVRAVRCLRLIVKSVAIELGVSFDGNALMASLLSFDVSSERWSIGHEEDKARLMLQCATIQVGLLSMDPKVGRPRSTEKLSDETRHELRTFLSRARMLFMAWCCQDYLPLCRGARERKNGAKKSAATKTGYESVLGDLEVGDAPRWLRVARTVLFLEPPSSPMVVEFLGLAQAAVEGTAEVVEEVDRLKVCFELGKDVRDDMLWIVLKAVEESSIARESALQLVEDLVAACAVADGGQLVVKDPMLVWELYNLAQFVPEQDLAKLDVDISPKNGFHKDMPRLANPGPWWRVTVLSLILCCANVNEIGSVIWIEHPSLRSIMKMVISGRFRFPTIDCDDAERERMKAGEQECRDKVRPRGVNMLARATLTYITGDRGRRATVLATS